MDGSQNLINFELRKKLPFISITIVHNGIEFKIDNVLIDTGSAATIFASYNYFYKWSEEKRRSFSFVWSSQS